eukprot:1586519-Prymnesium_polylepis.1
MRESQTSPNFCRFASGESQASTAASGEASSFAAASISNEGDSRAGAALDSSGVCIAVGSEACGSMSRVGGSYAFYALH